MNQTLILPNLQATHVYKNDWYDFVIKRVAIVDEETHLRDSHQGDVSVFWHGTGRRGARGGSVIVCRCRKYRHGDMIQVSISAQGCLVDKMYDVQPQLTQLVGPERWKRIFCLHGVKRAFVWVVVGDLKVDVEWSVKVCVNVFVYMCVGYVWGSAYVCVVLEMEHRQASLTTESIPQLMTRKFVKKKGHRMHNKIRTSRTW